MARLDPLARHDFMAVLMSAVAEDGLSIVLSSHVVAELERVCDYLVVLAEGHVQIVGDVEQVLATHRVLVGATSDLDTLPPTLRVVAEQRAGRQTRLLVRAGSQSPVPTGWQANLRTWRNWCCPTFAHRRPRPCPDHPATHQGVGMTVATQGMT